MSEVTRHTIRPGECIASLARRHGLRPDTIWEHADNAALREQRGDPNVLEAGDVVVVPARQARRESIASEQRHRFRARSRRSRIRLQLFRETEPRGDEPFVATIDGIAQEGTTDPEGWVEIDVPPDARAGTLRLTSSGEEYQLDLGHLDPADSARGIQQRLANLGLYGGALDGELGDVSRAALMAFQNDRGLEPSGELDDATRDALRDEHGS